MSRTNDAPWRVFFCLGIELLFYFLIWVAILTVGTVASIVLSASFGEIDGSIALGPMVVARFALLGGGIIMVRSHLPMYVANGITRRDFARGGLPVGLLLAVVSAALATGLVALESVVYDIGDWPHVLSNPDAHLFGSPDDYGMLFAELTSVFIIFLLCGCLIGSVFTRYGAPTGVLLIAPAALPAVGIEMLYASGAVGPLVNEVVGFDPTSLGLALAVSAVLVVLVAAVSWRSVRDVSIGNQRVVWWR